MGLKTAFVWRRRGTKGSSGGEESARTTLT